MIACIRETDDVFQFEIGPHIVGGIDKIFDFINMMGGGSIKRCGHGINAMLIG